MSCGNCGQQTTDCYRVLFTEIIPRSAGNHFVLGERGWPWFGNLFCISSLKRSTAKANDPLLRLWMLLTAIAVRSLNGTIELPPGQNRLCHQPQFDGIARMDFLPIPERNSI